ncbi:MAG: hypothetical protein WB777_14175 [Mycobacterium sp.]
MNEELSDDRGVLGAAPTIPDGPCLIYYSEKKPHGGQTVWYLDQWVDNTVRGDMSPRDKAFIITLLDYVRERL